EGGVPGWSPGTVVVARYEFMGNSTNNLNFAKMEQLIIVCGTSDPNWFKARNNNGDEGMIPTSHVIKLIVDKKKMVKLNTMPWLHGKINRNEAQNLLTPQEDGLFLVRE
ncbi:unnamed protein product, partial [Meganyctiphanes norvegica]